MAVTTRIEQFKDDPLYYYSPTIERERVVVERWPTFRDLVEIMHNDPTDYRPPFVIEGLIHLGRVEAAQTLAVIALATTPVSLHAHIRMALKGEWLDMTEHGPYPERDLRLALWVERERRYPTWT